MELKKLYEPLKNNPDLITDILLNNFNHNLAALKKYFPEIAIQFENYIPQKTMDFFCSPNGFPNIKFTASDRDFYKEKNPTLYGKFIQKITQSDYIEQFQDMDCPFAFSEYLTKEILKGKIVPPLAKKDYDPHGQIYYKYMNRIHDILANHQFFEDKYIQLKDCDFIPLFTSIGIGLGYHLEGLSTKLNIKNLLLIEPDPDVFFASLHSFDWASFIEKTFHENKTITLILDSDPDIIGRKFYLFLIEQGIFNIGGTYISNIYEDRLSAKILKSLKDFYISVFSAYGYIDDRAFGISHTWNAIKKKRNFVLTTPMQKKYSEYPVFVIGSGPSLDNDLKFIKKYQDKAIIVACGTALDSLYHAGVMPDFYANTERTPQVKQALDVIPDKDFMNSIILLSSNVCHPYVIDSFEKTAIFGKWDENFVDYLTTNLDNSVGFKNIQTIKFMNPLVGNMGISATVLLGFNKIYLFGIDNGKRQNTENMHSAYTSVYANSGASDKGGNYEIQDLVQGNFGGQCETNRIYIKSIISIESVLLTKKDDPEFKCINCSNGAAIKYSIPVHSKDLEKLFSDLPNLNKEEFLNYFRNHKTKNFDISDEQFKKIIHPEIMNRIYDNIIDMIDQSGNTKKEYFKLCQDINDFLKDIRTNISTFYARTAESSLNNMLVELVATLFGVDQKNSSEAAEEILCVIREFLIEAKELFAKLPDYCLGDHKKYYPDGKVGRDMPHCKAPDFPPFLNIIGRNYDDPVKKFVKKYE